MSSFTDGAAQMDEENQCCAGVAVSRSRRRRMRLRRTAVKKSLHATNELKSYLAGTPKVEGEQRCVGTLHEETIPLFLAEVDRTYSELHDGGMTRVESCASTQLTAVLDYLISDDSASSVVVANKHMHPERRNVLISEAGGRKNLRATLVAEILPVSQVPTDVVVNACFVPARKRLKDHLHSCELPMVATPDASDCCVEAYAVDEDARWEVGEHLTLSGPLRLYKHPRANKTLRGIDMQGIATDHADAGRPMMIEGRVRTLELCENRLKVVGKARMYSDGAEYRVNGWIERKGVT